MPEATRNDLVKQPPIVVGGTAGSGTRVAASILQAAGVFIGSNLNGPLDNLDFAFLLGGRIRWLERNFPFPRGEADRFLSMFKGIFFQQPLRLDQYGSLLRVGAEYLSGSGYLLLRRRSLLERLRKGLALVSSGCPTRRGATGRYQRWGWKSPEAIYFIPALARLFPAVKFIHMIRDGRDMAVSENRFPLRYAGLFVKERLDPVRLSFKHWCAVNMWASQAQAECLLQGHYLLVRYEELCLSPEREVDRIVDFCGLSPANVLELYRIPKGNPAIGRWKLNREHFRELETSVLAHFGYDCEGSK